MTMLSGVTQNKEIESLNKKLHSNLKKFISGKYERKIIYPQGSRNATVYFSKNLGFWWFQAAQNNGNRYFNWFGTESPIDTQNLNITVEINIPFKGRNFRISGIWAKDEKGNYFLMHDGGIGGGKPGIGKLAFQKYFNDEEQYSKVLVDGKVKDYYFVCELNSELLGDQLKDFVFAIKQIKELTKSPKTKTKSKTTGGLGDFNPEFEGVKTYGLPEKIKANCNHGIIVRELRTLLLSKNFEIANNQQIDLCIINNKKNPLAIFEIKTGLSRQSVYTALGQLILNSQSYKPIPKLIFVCPFEISKELISDLSKINVQVVSFQWKNNIPQFFKLEEITSSLI